MKVKRVVANLATEDLEQARVFYQDILGLDLLMDHGWIRGPDDGTTQCRLRRGLGHSCAGSVHRGGPA